MSHTAPSRIMTARYSTNNPPLTACTDLFFDNNNTFSLYLLTEEAIEETKIPAVLGNTLVVINDIPYGDAMDMRDVEWIHAFLRERACAIIELSHQHKCKHKQEEEYDWIEAEEETWEEFLTKRHQRKAKHTHNPHLQSTELLI
jgi:hypothetical protein